MWQECPRAFSEAFEGAVVPSVRFRGSSVSTFEAFEFANGRI